MQNKFVVAFAAASALAGTSTAFRQTICANASVENCHLVNNCTVQNGFCVPTKITPPIFEMRSEDFETLEEQKFRGPRFTIEDRNLLTTLLEDEELLVPDGEYLTTHQLRELVTYDEPSAILDTLKRLHQSKKGPIRHFGDKTKRRIDGSLEEQTNSIHLVPNLTLLGENEDYFEYNFNIDLINTEKSDFQVNDFDIQFVFDDDYQFSGDFKDCSVTKGSKEQDRVIITPHNVKPAAVKLAPVGKTVKKVKALEEDDSEDSEDFDLDEIIRQLDSIQNDIIDVEQQQFLSPVIGNTMRVTGLRLPPGRIESINIKCPTTTILRTKVVSPMINKFDEQSDFSLLEDTPLVNQKSLVQNPALLKFTTQALLATGETLTIVHHSDFKSSLAPWKLYTLIGSFGALVVVLSVIGYFIAKRLQNKKNQDSSTKSSSPSLIYTDIDTIDATIIPEEQQGLLSNNDHTIV